MTFNEFKLCCILFCKTFEGKQYSEDEEICWYSYEKCIIEIQKLRFENYADFGCACIGDYCLFLYCQHSELKAPSKNVEPHLRIKTVKDFLEHFKIPSIDIV